MTSTKPPRERRSRFLVFRNGEDGSWKFRLVGKSGKVEFESQDYPRKSDAIRGCDRLTHIVMDAYVQVADEAKPR